MHNQSWFVKRLGTNTDGELVCWKENKFTLIENFKLNFKNSYDTRAVFSRENVASLVILSENETKKTVIACSTHLLFSKARGDVKIGQAKVILDSIECLKLKYPDSAVFLGGDFNSLPNSGIHKLITTGFLDLFSLNRKKISGQYMNFYKFTKKSTEENEAFLRENGNRRFEEELNLIVLL